MLPLFAASIFLSAALLFTVQPLAGKVLLPLLGGSPAVWNACMLFFQGALLLGYLYAHVLSKVPSIRWQAIVHVCLLALAALTLPFPIDVGDPGGMAPTLWVARTLALTVGPGFVLVATSGPLLQRWFSRTGHASAGDPYFLYAASNLGSALGLLAYPLVIEPRLTRAAQAWWWMVGDGALIVLVAACAWVTMRRSAAAVSQQSGGALPDDRGACLAGRPTMWTRAGWVLLAAGPSSLMLGVTQYITTDLAAAPLFWIVPLLLYLLTFVAAFSRRRPSARVLGWVFVAPSLLIAAWLLLGVRKPIAWVLPTHVALFAAAALMCHTRLADLRPRAEGLTEFYMWISVGGVLGGCVNALAAPLVFSDVYEYGLVLGAVALARPQVARDLARPAGERISAARWRVRRVLVGLLAGAGVAGICLSAEMAQDSGRIDGFWWFDADEVADGLRVWTPVALAGIAAMWGGSLRFAACLIALLVCAYAQDEGERALTRERTFFGVHRVTRVFEAADEWDTTYAYTFQHGTTIHGRQLRRGSYAPGEARPDAARRFAMLFDRSGDRTVELDRERMPHLIPGTYYHPTGPLGDAVRLLVEEGRFRRAAFVGLGTGTTAAYSMPGSALTYFEIDPAVVKIATDPVLFSYVTDARAPETRAPEASGVGGVGRAREGMATEFLSRLGASIGEAARGEGIARLAMGEAGTIDFVLGDGRLELARSDRGPFDLIVLDAFTSDAIPVHLLTVEALGAYERKLSEGGLIAVHISNRFFDLEPVLAAGAERLGLVALVRDDNRGDDPDEVTREGKFGSTWVVLSRPMEEGTPRLSHGTEWVPALGRMGFSAWTDEYSNVLGILKLGR